MKHAILALSGGLDSTSLLLHLLANDFEVKTISFDYGQRHRVELECVKSNIKFLYNNNYKVPYQIIDLKSSFSDSNSALTSGVEVPEGHYADENMKLTVVENRNMIFASIILGKALSWSNKIKGGVDVCLAIHSGDHAIYKDCRPESRKAILDAFKISNDNAESVNYYTPYIDGSKFTILQDAVLSCLKLNLDFEKVFRNTNTCYKPDENGLACGKCGSCNERLEAFHLLGIKDPAQYV
jgi:7-cyano-7-deazaguanine synthase